MEDNNKNVQVNNSKDIAENMHGAKELSNELKANDGGGLETKRQNRAGIVMGILAILVSVIGSIFFIAFNYSQNINVPIGSCLYKIVYLLLALIIGCFVIILIYAVTFMYYELKRNDKEYSSDISLISKSDEMYHSFIKIIEVVSITLLVDIVFLTLIYFRDNLYEFVMGFTLIFAIISIIIVVRVITYRGTLNKKNMNILFKIVLPLLVVTSIMFFYLIYSNYNNNSNLSIEFYENGIVHVDKEGLDNNGIELMITKDTGACLLHRTYGENDDLRGYSGIFESIENLDADIKNAGNAIWNKTKVYSRYEICLDSIKCDNNWNLSVNDGGQYIITVLVNQTSRKVIAKTRFRVVNGRYIFVRDKISIDY